MINLGLPAYGLWSTEYASTSELGIAVHRTKKNGPKNRTFRTTTCYMTWLLSYISQKKRVES